MTQDIKDVLKLAFEALDNLLYWDNGKPEYDEAREAITAIKEALREHAMREVQRLGQEIEQEPVAWMDADGNVSDNNDHKCFQIPLYTTPPQRTWVGLTDDEMTHTNHHMVEGAYQYSFKQGAKWAEAKLKEKNT